jgi:hypothetical protein
LTFVAVGFSFFCSPISFIAQKPSGYENIYSAVSAVIPC